MSICKPNSRLKKAIQEEEHLLERGKETSVQYWHRVCGKLNISCSADKILASLWSRNYKQNAKVKKDVINLAKRLRDKYPLAVLSNTIKDHSVINRKRKNLFEYFDVVLLSNEIGLRKPQKEFFRLTSKELKIPFRNLIFVDNEMRWVRVARKYGFKAILFKSAEQLERALKKLGIRVD